MTLGVVVGIDPLLLERAGQGRKVSGELSARAEGIAAALDEQGGAHDPVEMVDPKPVGLAGRVEWIAEKKQSSDGKAFGDGHRSRAPTH